MPVVNMPRNGWFRPGVKPYRWQIPGVIPLVIHALSQFGSIPASVLHRDRLAVHTDQRIAITLLELLDFPLGGGLIVGCGFERAFAWRGC